MPDPRTPLKLTDEEKVLIIRFIIALLQRTSSVNKREVTTNTTAKYNNKYFVISPRV